MLTTFLPDSVVLISGIVGDGPANDDGSVLGWGGVLGQRLWRDFGFHECVPCEGVVEVLGR